MRKIPDMDVANDMISHNEIQKISVTRVPFEEASAAMYVQGQEHFGGESGNMSTWL